MLTEQDRESIRSMQDRINQSGRVSQRFMRMVCRDCIYDRATCGRNYKACEKEAKLYYELNDTNNVMEFVR